MYKGLKHFKGSETSKSITVLDPRGTTPQWINSSKQPGIGRKGRGHRSASGGGVVWRGEEQGGGAERGAFGAAMPLGKRFETELVPEWRHQCVDYKVHLRIKNSACATELRLLCSQVCCGGTPGAKAAGREPRGPGRGGR